MLTYQLEQRGNVPIYEYLYQCIKQDILNGILKPGEKLPSKRAMAKNHGIAVITVENAYAQLQVEGYIGAKEKSGFYVHHISQPAALEENSDAELQEPPTKVESKQWEIDFSSNYHQREAFPLSTWTKLLRRICLEKEQEFRNPPPPEGVWELREEIANYVQQSKGIPVHPHQVIVGAGTEHLHHLLMQLIGFNRLVAVEDPGYKKVGLLYQSHGMKCLYVPVDAKGMQVEALEGSNASLVHTSPSHHFPTGCVMSIDRRYELLRWARTHQSYIIEDDYDSELRLEGRPIPPLFGLDSKVVIYMNTFTKTLSPSIRIAYMILPEKLLQRYKEKLYFYASSVSSFEQYTLAAFIRGGYYERHINRLRTYYSQHRIRMLRALQQSKLANYVQVEEDRAGTHFVLYIKCKMQDADFRRALEEKSVHMLPVTNYCYNSMERYPHRFLIYYGDMEEDKLARGLEIMYTILKEQVSEQEDA